jgi:L-asparaginase
MDVTAEYLADAELEKTIVITGAMVPYSIDPTEATANLASAYGYISALEKRGIYIAMNGVMDSYEKVKKNRKEGRFTL